MHDDDGEAPPALSDEAAAETMSLVRTALGSRVTDKTPVDGSVRQLIESVTDHTWTPYSLWLSGTSVNVALCPQCASVSVFAFAPAASFIHGCVEVMEHLRTEVQIGGDPDEMFCTYKRIATQEPPGHHVYFFAGNYWLDFDGVTDRVFHAVRSLVLVIDEITSIIAAAAAAGREQN